jgi:hypothetical protein
MKEIKLTKDKFAIVDDEDYEWLNQWKWFSHKSEYAVRNIRKNGKRNMLFMHSVILNPPNGMFTDHINRNKLDNRRCNLRICTKSQNTINSRTRSDNKSGIKGVCWKKDNHKWVAQISHLGGSRHIGYYKNKQDAANAYASKAREIFGEFAIVE